MQTMSAVLIPNYDGRPRPVSTTVTVRECACTLVSTPSCATMQNTRKRVEENESSFHNKPNHGEVSAITCRSTRVSCCVPTFLLTRRYHRCCKLFQVRETSTELRQSFIVGHYALRAYGDLERVVDCLLGVRMYGEFV